MKRGRTIVQSLLAGADFPGEILTGVPVIEIRGCSEIVIICHRGVMEYHTERVQIATTIGPVLVQGEELRIHRMNRERIVLHGKVCDVKVGESRE